MNHGPQPRPDRIRTFCRVGSNHGGGVDRPQRRIDFLVEVGIGRLQAPVDHARWIIVMDRNLDGAAEDQDCQDQQTQTAQDFGHGSSRAVAVKRASDS